MASITLTIPDAQLPRVRAALCAVAGLPESNANAKQAVMNWVKATVETAEFAASARAQPPLPIPDVADIVT